MNRGGSDALGSSELPPSLRSSKSSWRLIRPGSKGEGQHCPAVLQETLGCHAERWRVQRGNAVVPSRGWYNWDQGESIQGPWGIPQKASSLFLQRQKLHVTLLTDLYSLHPWNQIEIREESGHYHKEGKEDWRGGSSNKLATAPHWFSTRGFLADFWAEHLFYPFQSQPCLCPTGSVRLMFNGQGSSFGPNHLKAHHLPPQGALSLASKANQRKQKQDFVKERAERKTEK